MSELQQSDYLSIIVNGLGLTLTISICIIAAVALVFLLLVIFGRIHLSPKIHWAKFVVTSRKMNRAIIESGRGVFAKNISIMEKKECSGCGKKKVGTNKKNI